ncbi:xanthine dehydrogenase family protein molybdopterin-binding subunit [Arenibaculum pallidiluteum]|uniref:xanthine dehydrogenase family protein molybdopterin-binding subunit n=1 Tax=Arenibaculum pallidiluteum TaxID=2812559 RepID=UPI001A959A53|nr:xanthine dehydrogenase family protein molybdopterin-binding subunit [Arenibaculum pallidiluteum]
MNYDPQSLLGQATPRVDGVAKVTGAARYAADEVVANPAYAYLVTSAIARGRIAGFRLEQAMAVPGVLDILTHENVGDALKQSPPGPDGKPSTTTLESERIWHDGQIIAVVVADTFEAAREAAHKVEVDYAEERPAGTFGDEGTQTEPAEAPFGPNPEVGDAAGAFAAAPVKVEARYATPTQHHNPLELFSTTCAWEGSKLTVYEPTQFMHGTKARMASQLGLDIQDVRAVSRYVGGAFGSKGVNGRAAWVAIAARRVGRPVKLVATRADGFTTNSYRAETLQHVRLSAERDGRLTSFFHEGWELSSRPSPYCVAGTEQTARMYACPNILTRVNVVHADRNTPGYMRAPAETPYMFALESAMDELSYALGMDPIELRRVNDTQIDPVSGRPFSSRSLMPCFDAAAVRFGWQRRDPQPGSMRDGEWLVGYGCATACYPVFTGPAGARLTLMPDGRAQVAMAGHELGTGAYTAVAITAARLLGIDVDDVTVSMGDSDLPPVIVAGGSSNAASTALATAKVCEEARRRLAAAAVTAADGPLRGLDPDALVLVEGRLRHDGGAEEPIRDALVRVGGRLEVYAEHVPDGLPRGAVAALGDGQLLFQHNGNRSDVTAFAFGAQLVEVRVHRRTREIRVPRVVSAFAAGTIINPMAARSQFMGGAIWGLASALHEATELDHGAARYVNKNLADYMIPVNADVPSVDIIILPEKDERVNALGIKGIGEVGIVGMNAAVANAVFHATGKRLRELPIRAERLL